MTHSAGIVLWRVAPADSLGEPVSSGEIEVLLAHPGGPFWAKKDEHAWSIPKGEFDPHTESAWEAARREFEEEIGAPCPADHPVALPPFRAGKKTLHAWLIAGDFDPTTVTAEDDHRSMVEMVWPPRSTSVVTFPEVDRVEWVRLDRAVHKLHKGQAPLVAAVRHALGPQERPWSGLGPPP